MFEKIIYGIVDYIVFQSQVLLSVCIAANFNMFSKKGVLLRSGIFLSIYLCLVLVVSVMDYFASLFLLYNIMMFAAWIVPVIWLIAIVKEKIINVMFYMFFSSLIFISAQAFCSLVDGISEAVELKSYLWLMSNENEMWGHMLILLRESLLFCVVFGITYFIIAKWFGRGYQFSINKSMIAIYGLISFLSFAFGFIDGYLQDLSLKLYLMFLSCEICYCALAEAVIYFIDAKISAEKIRIQYEADLKQTKYFWSMEKKQYEFVKENIDVINIKCHDMRHFISEGKTGTLKKEFENIEKNIAAYDSVIHTGNNVLDIILTEKSLVCLRKNIKFLCVADGTALKNVDEVSLYSLFGNAIENAINYVDTFYEEEKRFITVNVRKNEKMAVISIENIFEGVLDFENGLPKTSQDDKNYHGFGLKSIRSVAEKYGGGMTVAVNDCVFSLTVIIPFISD